jgi:hypothetical protein
MKILTATPIFMKKTQQGIFSDFAQIMKTGNPGLHISSEERRLLSLQKLSEITGESCNLLPQICDQMAICKRGNYQLP